MFRRLYREGALKDALWEALVLRFQAMEEQEGLTQADVARLSGRPPASVCRALRRPQNYTAETMAALLNAMDAVLKVDVIDARAAVRRCTGAVVAASAPTPDVSANNEWTVFNTFHHGAGKACGQFKDVVVHWANMPTTAPTAIPIIAPLSIGPVLADA